MHVCLQNIAIDYRCYCRKQVRLPILPTLPSVPIWAPRVNGVAGVEVCSGFPAAGMDASKLFLFFFLFERFPWAGFLGRSGFTTRTFATGGCRCGRGLFPIWWVHCMVAGTVALRVERLG